MFDKTVRCSLARPLVLTKHEKNAKAFLYVYSRAQNHVTLAMERPLGGKYQWVSFLKKAT